VHRTRIIGDGEPDARLRARSHVLDIDDGELEAGVRGALVGDDVRAGDGAIELEHHLLAMASIAERIVELLEALGVVLARLEVHVVVAAAARASGRGGSPTLAVRALVAFLAGEM